jgi:hypothetical protein
MDFDLHDTMVFLDSLSLLLEYHQGCEHGKEDDEKQTMTTSRYAHTETLMNTIQLRGRNDTEHFQGCDRGHSGLDLS